MKRLPCLLVILAAIASMGAAPQDLPPEMKILKRFVGTWDNEIVSTTADQTLPEEQRKTVGKTRPILGGRFVQGRTFDSQGKLYNLFMYTYDPAKKVYRQWYFDSRGGAFESVGQWDKSTQTLTFTTDFGDGVTGVFEVHFVDKDKLEFAVVSKDADGTVQYSIKGTSTRQK